MLIKPEWNLTGNTQLREKDKLSIYDFNNNNKLTKKMPYLTMQTSALTCIIHSMVVYLQLSHR